MHPCLSLIMQSRSDKLPGFQPDFPASNQLPIRHTVRLSILASIVDAAAITVLPLAAHSQTIVPAMFSRLRYRFIGPCRGTRTVGVAAIPDQPNTSYVGFNNG